MLNDYELSKLIINALSNEFNSDAEDLEEFEEIKTLSNELSRIADDSFVKLALLRLCEKIINKTK